MSVVADKYRGSKEYLLVYCELIQAARYKGVTNYQAVAKIMSLPLTGNYMAKETGQMLGKISEDELKHGRPMLSVLVVGTSGLPGAGFFALARQLGKLQDDSPAAERSFWEQEKAAVYNTWHREFKTP